jgi:hypothetical protein
MSVNRPISAGVIFDRAKSIFTTRSIIRRVADIARYRHVRFAAHNGLRADIRPRLRSANGRHSSSGEYEGTKPQNLSSSNGNAGCL